jgi:hypothetical protein
MNSLNVWQGKAITLVKKVGKVNTRLVVRVSAKALRILATTQSPLTRGQKSACAETASVSGMSSSGTESKHDHIK